MAATATQTIQIHANKIQISNKTATHFLLCLGRMVQMFLRYASNNSCLKRVGRVSLVNKCYWDVIKKTTMSTIAKMFLQVFLHARYVMCMFTRVRSVIISPIAKSVNFLTYILFSTFVTSKEIIQAFLHAVKFMINFVSFSCNCTGKTVRLINICTNLATWFFLKDPPDLSTGYNLALTKYLLKETIGRGVK